MSKNIVICFDGTWNTLDSGYPPTNVQTTAMAIAPKSDDGQTQPVFYDEGVGSGKVAVARKLDKFLGGAFGLGLMQNIEDAYRFLIFNYETGDKIFIFGFSRGAFSARSLAGLIRNCGIPRKNRVSYIRDAIDLYKSRDKEQSPDAEQSKQFRKSHGVPGHMGDTEHNVDIEYIGIWDTVGALGVPRHLFFANYFNKAFQFHDCRLSRSVKSARHAVAIDENRRIFDASVWDNLAELNKDAIAANSDPLPYLQQWFPGDHGSVGGGGTEVGLSEGAFVWVIQGAMHRGLKIEESVLEDSLRLINHKASLNCMGQKGPVYNLYRFVTRKSRSGPDIFTDLSNISTMARDRFVESAEELPERKLYRPRSLRPFEEAVLQEHEARQTQGTNHSDTV